MPFRASAPASLMFLGEYAVLYGKHALVCALNRRVHVTLSPRADHTIQIRSYRPAQTCVQYDHSPAPREHPERDALQFGQSPHVSAPSRAEVYTTTLQALTLEPPFQFVLAVLQQYQSQLTHGCTIEIESEFSDRIGLGSSAAVTVATLATVLAWLGVTVSVPEYVRIARLIVQKVQGLGSGADVAASIFGGLITYRMQPLIVEQHTTAYPLTVLYSGAKTPTTVAVKQVQQTFAHDPKGLRRLCEEINHCVTEGIRFIQQQAHLSCLGAVLIRQQALFAQLSVNTPLLQDMVDSLCAQPGIFGAKISGAGLGDCVIALGHPPDTYVHPNQQVQRIPVRMSMHGVHCETL